MDLKQLGLRFGLSYLMSRASGQSQKSSAIDSLLGSTIAQASEDVTGFTPEIAEVTTLVVDDLIKGRTARVNNEVLPDNPVPPAREIEVLAAQVSDPALGLTSDELLDEVTELSSGINEAYDMMLRLERLQAGILRRNS